MDEFIWSPRLVRRMALLGLVNCVALQTTAAEQAATPDRPVVEHRQTVAQQNLGSLLKNGWESSAKIPARSEPSKAEEPVSPAVTPAAKPQPTVTAAVPLVIAEPAKSIIPPQVAPKQAAEPNQAVLPRADRSLVPILPTPQHQPEATAEQVESSGGLNRVEAPGDALSLSDLLKKAPDVSAELAAVGESAEPRAARPTPPSSNDLVERSLEIPSRISEKSALLRDAAANSGFGMLALDSLDAAAVDTAAKIATPSQSEIIQSARLQEVAQRLLREANNSLRRKADFTARKKATAALRTAVAMRDAVAGDNQHSRDLESALDAIREARDFGVGTSAIDHAAMKRLVAVHKTAVLKGTDLSNVSSVGAMSSYLEFAHDKLVAAAGQGREASESLLLLGQVEKRSNVALDPVASAITLAYQRAAADIDPANATAFYEMGRSLDRAGMVDQARLALTKSIQMVPTRSGYKQLMETARKAGDIDTVKYCKHALDDENLPPETAVVRLEPGAFAAMHRPQPAQRAVPKVPATQKAAPRQDPKLQQSSSEVPAMSRLKTWFTRDR